MKTKSVGEFVQSLSDPTVNWDVMCDSYRRINTAGAILAAGTDYQGAPLTKFGANAVELEYLVDYCDFTPMEAIVSATKNAAMACFMGEETGTIESGKLADIIVVDGDPLTDIKILQDSRKIKKVMLAGKVEIDRAGHTDHIGLGAIP